MLNVLIDEKTTVVENNKLMVKWTIKTTDFFGVVYSSLEKNFPDFDCDKIVDYIDKHIMDKLAERTPEKEIKIFGLTEIGMSLYDLLFLINNYVNDKGVIALSLKDVETLRLSHRMEKTFLPIGISEQNGMRFNELTSVTQVVIASLYYYAYNDYKLVRCEHCGRWFATHSLKNKYCSRNSPVEGYTHLNCEQAVRNIKYQCTRIKNRIETKANNSNKDSILNHSYSSFVPDFQTQCDSYLKDNATKHTVENLSEYMAFLRKVEKEKRWLNNGNNK